MAVLMRGGTPGAIAFALAAILLVATAPVFVFAPVVADSVPALSPDICHPVPSISSPCAITLAAAPAQWTCAVPAPQGFLPPTRGQVTTRLGDAPDPPPPKIRA